MSESGEQEDDALDDEAIAEFEKAMKLGPYPVAAQGLEEAKKARDAANAARRY